MGKARPIDKRIAEIEERQKQLEQQKRDLKAQAKGQERKDRTRQLIQIGAIFDSMGIHTVVNADSLKKELINDPKLWERIIKLAGAPWPPDTLLYKAAIIRNTGEDKAN